MILVFWAAAFIGCTENPASPNDETTRLQAISGDEASGPSVDVPLTVNDAHVRMLNLQRHVEETVAYTEECCTDPGDIAQCWMVDAEDDGVACDQNSDCPSGACDNSVGLCTCASDSECRNGVCTEHNICGPSWCNGTRECSCWGQCSRTNPSMTYDILCADNGLACCEGEYPIHPDLRDSGHVGTGYCAESMMCGDACMSDDDCASDDNACTTKRCDVDTGVCVTDLVVCDDGNACTDDTCDALDGCVYTPNDDACNDGDACTTDDVCSAGTCSGTAATCSDGNPCTDDACDSASGCVFENNTDACDDGNACTADDVCAGGVCIGGTTVSCDDGNVCTDNSCDPNTGCVSTNNTSGCNDNDACTTNDVCADGGCVGGPALECDDGNVCTDDSCDSVSGCRHLANTDACDDGNACTENDTCANKVCYGSTVDCDDANECTDDSCNSATGCVHSNNTDSCDDGNACLVNDKCVLGGCAGTETLDCDDGNPCTDDACDSASGCVHTPNTVGCDDGNMCTENDVCSAGVCNGAAISCNDDNPCTDDACDVSTGCVHANNTATCDDGEVCTSDDVCSGGLCAGTSINCDDANVCTTDSCVSGVGCAHAANTESCDDNNMCTTNDACADEVCGGTPLDCDDGDLCTEDTCNVSTGCVHTDIDPCYACNVDADCADDITCNPGPVGCSEAVCSSGNCICEPLPIDTYCSDYSEADYPPNCYYGLCDDAGGCQPTIHAAENNLCSDAFDADDPTVINTADDTYLGEFSNTDSDGALLEVTGSTLCANNNYYSTGDECLENSTGNNIGTNGRDLVYVFRYQANALTQYDLYSFIIKVEADYDIGMYIMSDITSASQCPEGNNPDLDDHDVTYLPVVSETCSYPYQNSPMPPVTEDECRDNGNTLNSQDCCDSCIDGDYCGYKWCKRGYNLDGTSCNMCSGAGGAGYDAMTYTGNCDALWTYPEDPHNCDSETPDDSGYDDYNYMASAVISPHGITDGEWHNVFVFIDGVDGSQGNFYMTVEKRRWWSGPCDRINDDARVYNVTDVGTSGETFQGTFEGVVNSMHSSGGSCGGYSCTSGWGGRSNCHEYSTPTAFWPNQEIFKIQRRSAQGSAVYCITTDESITDGADIVSVLVKRRSGALTICDESYSTVGCQRNSVGNNIQWEFTASPGELYLVEFSQYENLGRVCSPSAGDDCLYKISVYTGGCPVTCTGPSSFYSGSVAGTFTIDGTSFSPSSAISGNTSSSSKNHDAGQGWNGRDDLWQINVTADATVRFSGCSSDGGSGSMDAQMAIYNCTGDMVAQSDDNCGGSSAMPAFDVALSTSNQPYYLVVDGYQNNTSGAYSIALSYR